jgi:hypothetical protein
LLITLEIPKSVMQCVPSSIKSIFLGLISRWIMPIWFLRKCKPSNTYFSRSSISISLKIFPALLNLSTSTCARGKIM